MPQAVKNNGGAKLPAGRMYLSFPVWTMELLAEHQARKADVEERASVYIKEKNDKLAAMQETDNLWKKANLYREAASSRFPTWIKSSGFRTASSWETKGRSGIRILLAKK
jgi:hypothetical protein